MSNKNNITGTDYQALIEKAVEKDRDFGKEVSRELTADIVVVGSGAAGMPAAVEAVNAGKKVILVEHAHTVGGNGILTEGLLAVDSPLSRAQNVHVSVDEVVKHEQNSFHYETDGARLYEMVRDSGKNIQWLIDNGVQFTGEVDADMSDGYVRVYHWFAPKYQGTGFINPLKETFEKKGGVILLDTDAKRVIQDASGKVTGLYAIDAEGKVLRINAGAVILATGGFENNRDILASRGYDPDHLKYFGAPGHDGSGLYMALDAGGANYLEKSALLESPTNLNMPIRGNAFMQIWMNLVGDSILVNEDGERFFDESAGTEMRGYPMLAVRNQAGKGVFEIYSDDILNAAIARMKYNEPRQVENAKALWPETLAQHAAYAWKADTIEELAKESGIRYETLKETIDNYNLFASKRRHDDQFGKAPEHLWRIDPPYYCVKYTDVQYITTFGGVHTGRHSEVLDERHQPVPGLYAVGTLGTELWNGHYTICVPGGANAFNVDSGRKAAIHAIQNYTRAEEGAEK